MMVFIFNKVNKKGILKPDDISISNLVTRSRNIELNSDELWFVSEMAFFCVGYLG